MKQFFLTLLFLLLVIPRSILLALAFVIVSLAAQVERAEEWLAGKRGLPITPVGEEDN